MLSLSSQPIPTKCLVEALLDPESLEIQNRQIIAAIGVSLFGCQLTPTW